MEGLIDSFNADGSQLTTDPLVVYDPITQTFNVKIDDTTEAEIYGGNRNQRAFELADLIRAGHYGENTEAI